MQFFDFMEKIPPSTRIRIIRDGELVFQGYKATFTMETLEEIQDPKENRIMTENPDIRKINPYTEIATKKQQEQELISPVNPKEMLNFQFSDISLSIFLEIHLS